MKAEEMTREEVLCKQSQKYRDFREECGVQDPILLDEVDEAYFTGAMWADKTMLEKVRKCFKENAMDLYLYHCKGADIDDVTDDFMSRLKAMMEE